MKRIILWLAILPLLLTPADGKEKYVNVREYVQKAETIIVCVVDKDNGDGTVMVRVRDVLKGKAGESQVLRGQTGHCVMRGPVSRFMKPQREYLVFVFANNTVGRLGGILEIEARQTLHLYYVHGFTGTRYNSKTQRPTLTVSQAKRQIKLLLQKAQ